MLFYLERLGRIFRGDVAPPLASTARIVAPLDGLTAGDPRSPLGLKFPAAFAPLWMLGLFPARTL